MYEFKHEDPAYALGHATYRVTFVRQSNGGYKSTYRITDKYDFAMQTLGLIKPFNISITYKQ